jgi:hypothetical protein
MTTTSDDCRCAVDAIDQTEATLLGLLLIEHPTTLTSDELVLHMAPDDADSFRERDAVLCAISSLVGCGLARRSGEHVAPTYAAIRAGTLLGV